MKEGSKYICDGDGCKSSCTLADPTDLKEPDQALEKRGWTVVHSDTKPDHHLCSWCVQKAKLNKD